MVESTVSGPMPSPGMRVAVMGFEVLIENRLIMVELIYFISDQSQPRKTKQINPT